MRVCFLCTQVSLISEMYNDIFTGVFVYLDMPERTLIQSGLHLFILYCILWFQAFVMYPDVSLGASNSHTIQPLDVFQLCLKSTDQY